MLGAGLPVALQWNVTMVDSKRVRSVGAVIKLGETVKENERKHCFQILLC